MKNKFMNLSKADQNILVVNTAKRMNMPEAIVEKDFWVCFILDYLFTTFKYRDFICFKGGTSLSKIYNCIERFSEDIDLALDWSVLGLLEDEVHAERSHRQQDFFNKEANNKTAKYIQQIWLPILKNDLSKLISEDFEVFIDKLDPQTICFRYPRLYQDSSILQILRLEIGVLAEPVPFQIKSLKSYISNSYTDVFNNEVIIVKTMDIKRTFFEKLTILHRESMRTNNNYPLRYSRHYYDIYQMIQKGIADEALEEFKLLKMVVDFKKKFYPCKWANYDDVLQGKCQLVPNSDAIEFFSHDYDKMRSMLYGSYPTFNEIIYVLEKYEKKINLLLKIDYNISKIKS